MERNKYLRNYCAACGVLLLMLAGCSSLKGEKYTYGESKEGGQLNGVPFTLNKMIPTVVYTPGTEGKPDTYVTTFSPVADSTQRYVLTMAPPTLSSVDFSLSFDAQGSLTEGSAKTTDQSAAIATSIVKLLLAADSSGSSSPLQELINAGDALGFVGRERQVWDEIKAEWFDIQKSGSPEGEFAYWSVDERNVLAKIFSKKFGDLLSKAHAEARRGREIPAAAPAVGAKVDEKTLAAGGGPAAKSVEGDGDVAAHLLALQISKLDDAGTKFSKDIVNKLNYGDIEGLKSELASTKARIKNLRTSLEQKGDPDSADRLAQAYKDVGLLSGVVGAIPSYLQVASSFVRMDASDRTKRLLARLNKSINEQKQLVLLAQAAGRLPKPIYGVSECYDRDRPRKRGPDLGVLCELQEKKALLLGVSSEQRRRDELSSSLTKTNSAKDLKLIRDEIASLDATIAQAESNLKSSKTSQTAVEGPYVAEVLRLDASDDINNAVRALKDKLIKRPRYIVVLKSLEPAGQVSEQSQKPAEESKSEARKGEGEGGVAKPKEPDEPQVLEIPAK